MIIMNMISKENFFLFCSYFVLKNYGQIHIVLYQCFCFTSGVTTELAYKTNVDLMSY